jgi:hypothetical protein
MFTIFLRHYVQHAAMLTVLQSDMHYCHLQIPQIHFDFSNVQVLCGDLGESPLEVLSAFSSEVALPLLRQQQVSHGAAALEVTNALQEFTSSGKPWAQTSRTALLLNAVAGDEPDELDLCQIYHVCNPFALQVSRSNHVGHRCNDCNDGCSLYQSVSQGRIETKSCHGEQYSKRNDFAAAYIALGHTKGQQVLPMPSWAKAMPPGSGASTPVSPLSSNERVHVINTPNPLNTPEHVDG